MEGDDFLDKIPKAQVTKAKLNKWLYIKFRSFCAEKEMSNRMKTHPTEWEKYLQTTYLTKYQYTEFISNFKNSTTTRTQLIQLRNGKRSSKHSSQEKKN